MLELGCGVGGNLIPMAEELPGSAFIGVDSSPRQIAMGQATIEALHLKNIHLMCMDLLDIQHDFGQFDYIIAHGLYSWVPPHVQDHLLNICQCHLCSNGIAYVSYNTYPGWHIFTMLRDMMLYRTWGETDPHERATQAMDFLDFLQKAIPEENKAFGDFLTVYIDFLRRKAAQADDNRDAFLLHDELSEVNQPVHFYQFVAHAAYYGLQYITDTDISTTIPDFFPPPVASSLRAMARNRIDIEQYMDFVRGRTFRESLLCHQHMRLERQCRRDRVHALHIASPAQPLSAHPDCVGQEPEHFRAAAGSGTVALDHPLSKAAMLHLAALWPATIDFSALVGAAYERLCQAAQQQQQPEPHITDQDTHLLAANLLGIFMRSTKLLHLRTRPMPVAPTICDYPCTRPLARLQAQDTHIVTNMLHERVRLDEIQRLLLIHLDGTHSHAALQAILQESNQAYTNGEQDLEQHLNWLQCSALLIP